MGDEDLNRIRSLREDRDLRQIDVAKATGIDQKTLSNYETEKTNPDSYSIIKLADFFNVSTDYLLGVNDVDLSNNEKIVSEIKNIQMRLKNISDYFSKNGK